MATAASATATVVLALACFALFQVSEAVLDNAVTKWQVETQKTVAALSIPNQLSGRVYGAVSRAQYNALKLARKSYEDADQAAVVAYAAHYVLSQWFPWRQSNVYDGVLAAHISSLNLTSSQRSASEKTAIAAAKKVLDDRASDGVGKWARFVPAPTNTTASIGKYQYTPGQTFALYPQLAKARPFGVDPSRLESITRNYKKHVIGSKAYDADLNRTQLYGSLNSAVRTSYDNTSAFFWADGAGTSAIGGHYISVAFLVLPDNLSIWNTARFFSAFGTALFDASIACWKVKYRELFWRPITAIRYGDGIHTPDPSWTPLLATPPHPEYPSGHQCTVGAALHVLQTYLRRDDVTFTIGSEGLPGVTRTYTSLRTSALEVGDSRLYAGVHFPKSNADGLQLGIDAAKEVLKSYPVFRP